MLQKFIFPYKRIKLYYIKQIPIFQNLIVIFCATATTLGETVKRAPSNAATERTRRVF